MKTIDWTKPLRTTTRGISAKLVGKLDNEEYVVSWFFAGRTRVAHVDRIGCRLHESGYPDTFPGSISGVGGQLVENVPEEPKDHIRLWHDGDNWRFGGISGVNPRVQPVTKTEAETWLHGPAAQKRTIVKVPV